MPDTAANLIDRNRQFLTLAIHSDILVPITGGFIGYKIAAVFNPRRLKGFDKYAKPESYNSNYVANTFHLTIRRVTGYCQLNIGSFALGLQLGANLRLGK
ncbi:hypothetical protein [Paraflavitalea speifideaquila]|uniref:hypothetical protein n=1 Tax=Paraflavitalea speifideaquila TaxID=3076558 RepID=UPI0028EDC1CC|nr:hypothetical protein [Paraflavitalea speifideiaquila]